MKQKKKNWTVFETLNSWNPIVQAMFKLLAYCDQKALLLYYRHRTERQINIAIQGGNASNLLETLPIGDDAEDFFKLICKYCEYLHILTLFEFLLFKFIFEEG